MQIPDQDLSARGGGAADALAARGARPAKPPEAA